jgi:hypothetical protein
MNPADLNAFPMMERVFQGQVPQPNLAGTPVETLFEAALYQLDDVERSLRIMEPRWGLQALVEQTSKLFSNRWGDWDCARTELLALSTIESDGSLDGLGWPPGYGGNAPFDGVLRDTAGTSALISFDVKSAQGSGLLLIQERLEPVAQAWATQSQLGGVQLVIDHHGATLTQQSIQRDIGRLLAEFRAALAAGQAVLPITVTLTTTAGTRIGILVEASSGAVVHAGVGSVAARVSSIRSVMQGHLNAKTPIASQHARPYVLVYVRPFGAGGSDLRPDETLAAARELDTAGAPQWWLGTLFLDWSRGTLERRGLFRTVANYPAGSSSATVRATVMA